MNGNNKEYVGKHGIVVRVGKRIGKGGNAKVYSATIDSSSDYVIKILNSDCNKKRRIRFKHEIKSINFIYQHYNGKYVLKILEENFSKKYNCWYVMPKGKCLKDLIKDNTVQIPTLDKIKYCRELAVAILHFHKIDYVHRDIKPENIFLFDNEIRVGDLGLVWQRKWKHITSQNERLGSLSTLAPEMEAGRRPKDYDQYFTAADIYSFAKTMWILLTERRRGFIGAYNPNIFDLALEKNIKDCQDIDFKPLNDYLVIATSEDYKIRGSMLDAIEAIDKFIELNQNGNGKEEKYSEYKLNNALLEFADMNEFVYSNIDEIVGVLKLCYRNYYFYDRRLSVRLNVKDVSKERDRIILIDDMDNHWYITVRNMVVKRINEIDFGKIVINIAETNDISAGVPISKLRIADLNMICGANLIFDLSDEINLIKKS